MTAASAEPCDKLPLQTVRPLRGIEREALRVWAARRGHVLVEVELTGSAGKPELLAAIARAFRFPAWFGMNLDALYDSLTDLPAPEGGGGYVVLLDGLAHAAGFNAQQRAALLDVFRDAGERFAERSIPFRVLYR
jgi:RNAse (barnase) inhibitor barstar